MATLNEIKNRVRTLGLTGEDDEVKSDSPMAASARAKALDKYDMASGTYSGPGTLISNVVRAIRGDLGTEANARKEMGAKAAREADAEVKREMRGVQKTETDRAREEANEMKLQKATDKAYNDSLKGMAKGGMTASSRADGIAQRGKTRGKMC